MRDILQGKLGFGTAPLGNMYRNIPEEEAIATVDAAWESGIRYFDSAPFYGAGLAEMRLGEALSKRNRNDYILSTKVGRVISDELEDPSARDLGVNRVEPIEVMLDLEEANPDVSLLAGLYTLSDH